MSARPGSNTLPADKSVYAVCGGDAFRTHETVAALCKALTAQRGADSPTRYDGETAELAEVLDEVRTYSLLGGLRVVIVDEADAFISEHRAALERYCSEPASSGVLIFTCTNKSLAATTKLAKIITTLGEVIRFEPLKGTAVQGWIASRAQGEYGKRIEPAAAGRLRELVGTDPGALDAELSKLAIYVRERPQIVVKDVEALVGRTREEEIWGVLDALASGQTARALTLWEQVLATDRAAEHRAVAGLAWGVRKLLDLKLQAERGVPVPVLARQAFATPEVMALRLKRSSIAQLHQQLIDLAETDLATKTGLAEVPTAIERFLVKHSAVRQAV